jgi:hypothetical protein
MLRYWRNGTYGSSRHQAKEGKAWKNLRKLHDCRYALVEPRWRLCYVVERIRLFCRQGWEEQAKLIDQGDSNPLFLPTGTYILRLSDISREPPGAFSALRSSVIHPDRHRNYPMPA